MNHSRRYRKREFTRQAVSCSVFLLVFLAVFSGSVLVQKAEALSGVPQILSYQGRLADADGDLLGGSGTTYYFKFSIWNVTTGGTSGTNRLWPGSDPSSVSATVRQGVFNADIDTSSYNFNTNSTIYLQVEASSDDATFETLSPRQQISSAAFAQIAGSVSGVGQSSFGTTTPVSNAVVTVEATTTSSIPLLIRASTGQTANLLRIEDSLLNNLFSINSLGGIFASSTFVVGTSTATSFIVDSSGNVGVGTSAPSRKFNILDVNSVAQMRLSQSGSVYGEVYVDATGDVQLSSTGGNIRQNNENLWVCSSGSCGADTPADKGNVIVETSIIFDNEFRLKQIDASTTIMYDTTNTGILEFDEGQ